MKIRKAVSSDITRIDEIYKIAKAYMNKEGNTTQWSDNYPSLQTIKDDLDKEWLYVVENDEERVVAVFVFTLIEEPSYRDIDGEWHYDERYGVIHRIASDGSGHGITKLIYSEALKTIPYLRVDTHRANKTMRAALKAFGFRECGKVYYTRDNERTERIAYDFNIIQREKGESPIK